MQGETLCPVCNWRRAIFQSTPPMQGETLPSNICFKCRAISIHSPYAGGDVRKVKATDNKKISIHSPYAGGDIKNRCLNAVFENFNPLPLCRGRHSGLFKDASKKYISIHSPYAGGDAVRFRWFYGRCYFNPLPLCRGRHHGIYISKLTRIISIHSPYAGGDSNI